MSTLDFWRGPEGDAYTERNQVDWHGRIRFWQSVLGLTKARSVLEIGCNAGWNLRALRDIDPTLDLQGIDVNDAALAEARHAGLSVDQSDAMALSRDAQFDLVFTAGLLIHVPPVDIAATMAGIVRASRSWVVAVEYGAEREEMVTYRGQQDALWKRPFGYIYEQMGLHLVRQGTVGKADGFDDCTWWAFLVSQIRLIDVYECPDAPEILWRLLLERPASANISHRAMPTRAGHERFVASRSYTAWYLIAVDNVFVGAVYLSNADEIGVAVLREYRGHGHARQAIEMLIVRHPRRRYLANIAPGNDGSKRLFRGFGFRHIQNTYVHEP